MSDQPLVSAITIFLNGEKYIEEAIASVRAQTYDRWELLLVDDGSTDSSTQISKEYTKRYPEKIRYLEHDGHANRGMSASRNLGVAHARGQFVAFLDSDDVWTPNKLVEQVALLQRYPEAAIIYGRTLIWNSWSRDAEERNRDYFFDLGVVPDQVIQPPVLFYLLLKNKAQTPTTCNALFRRDLLAQLGGFEDSFCGMYEDQVVFAKIDLEFPVYVSSKCWAKYRQHPESSSMLPFDSQNYCSTRLPFLTWLSAYLDEKGVQRNSPLQKAVQREMWICRHPGYLPVLNQYRQRKEQIVALLWKLREKNKDLGFYR